MTLDLLWTSHAEKWVPNKSCTPFSVWISLCRVTHRRHPRDSLYLGQDVLEIVTGFITSLSKRSGE